MTIKPINTGWIEVICGSMFSGKTEELIRRLRRAKIAKMSVSIYKPIIDSRYSDGHIVSHNQSEMESHSVSNSKDILNFSKNYQVIGIDEAQFFDDGLVKVCKKLADSGKRVIIAGLDMDYLGNGFGPMPRLIKIANQTTKLHATCDMCGGKACHTYRKSTDDNKILLGEKDNYLALCKKCFKKNMKKDV